MVTTDAQSQRLQYKTGCLNTDQIQIKHSESC